MKFLLYEFYRFCQEQIYSFSEISDSLEKILNQSS